MRIRDVAQLVRVCEQKLVGTPSKRQPSGDMLFAHLWQDTPVGCGFQHWAPISEDVKDIRRSFRRSRLRTFPHLMKRIKAALELKREAINLAAVQRELTGNDIRTMPSMPAVPLPPGAGIAQRGEEWGIGEEETPAMPMESTKKEKKASEKGKPRPRSGSRTRRHDPIATDAQWPKDAEWKRKKVAEFSRPERKLMLCTYE